MLSMAKNMEIRIDRTTLRLFTISTVRGCVAAAAIAISNGAPKIATTCNGLFEKMLREAAKESSRTVRVAEIKTQAPDHPALLAADETTYLKFYVLHVL